jgi:hypothetical protein
MNKIFCDFLNEKILPFMFAISNKPVSFAELLEANKQVADSIIPNSTILGFRMKAGKSYLVFLLLSHFVIIPVILILHNLFKYADCHLSILLAILFTGLFFISFTLFKEYIIDKMSLRQLKIAWRIHFPFFEFENYHRVVASIYLDAINKKISKSQLEFFVFEELSKIKQ